ncbi:MAG: hypothetical protein O8C67_02035 [Candidatus Methanoperedens sp.]|nr:hypothetical protein [Candidatus Methanoperedens sp.]
MKILVVADFAVINIAGMFPTIGILGITAFAKSLVYRISHLCAAF